MSAYSESKIRRINKSCMPAAWRQDRVEKIRKIAACVEKHERPAIELWLATHWCKECGFPVDDHASFRADSP